MTITDILNSYDKVKDNLEFQNVSNVRTKIMINLSEGPMKTKELQKSIGMPYSTILYGISELEKENLVSSGGDYYYLSKIGKETASKLIDMIRTFIALKNYRKLWLNHKIDAIPPNLLTKIGDLSNSELIESENTDLAKTHETHIQVVLNSKEIRGVSPIFYSDYMETFTKILKKGVKVKLILTDAVLKKTIKSINSIDDLDKLISNKNLTIWKLDNDIKVAFTVTDKSMTLGLFSNEGIHDSNRLLMNDHKDALLWGSELFEYYLKKAQRVNLEDFKEIYFN